MKQFTIERYPVRATIMTDILPGELTSFDQIPDTSLRMASKKEGKLHLLFIKLDKFDDVKNTDLTTQFASSIIAEKLITALEKAIVAERLYGPEEEDNQFDYTVAGLPYGTRSVFDIDGVPIANDEHARQQWIRTATMDLNMRIGDLLRRGSFPDDVGRHNFGAPSFAANQHAPSFELALIEPSRPNQPHGIRVVMRVSNRVMITLEPKESFDTINTFSQNSPYGSFNRDVDIVVGTMVLTAKIIIYGFNSPEAKSWFSDETLKCLVLGMTTDGLRQYNDTLSLFNFNKTA